MANLSFIEEMSGLGFESLGEDNQENKLQQLETSIPKVEPESDLIVGESSDDTMIGGEGFDKVTPPPSATFADLDKQLGIKPTQPKPKKETSITDFIPSFVSTAKAGTILNHNELIEEAGGGTETDRTLDRAATYTKNYFKNSYNWNKNVAKSAVYGLSKLGIAMGAEFVVKAPVYAVRGAFVFDRSMEELGKWMLDNSLGDVIEATGKTLRDPKTDTIIGKTIRESDTGKWIEDNTRWARYVKNTQEDADGNVNSKNLSGDVFDTQTDIDEFLNTYFVSAVDVVGKASYNALDYFVDLEGEYEDFENIDKMDASYKKWLDRSFKAYEVAPEDQSVVGKTVMYTGEFLVPLGLFGQAGKAVKTTKNIFGTLGSNREKAGKLITEIREQTQKRLNPEQNLYQKMLKKQPKSKPISNYEKALRESAKEAFEKREKIKIPFADRPLGPSTFSPKHVGAGNLAVSLNKALGLGDEQLGMAAKKALGYDLNIALGAGAGMAITEKVLDVAGLSEYKPYSLIVGLGTGLMGAKNLVGLIESPITATNKVGNLIMHHVYGRQGRIEESRRQVLKYHGYSDFRINKMSEEEQIEKALLSPAMYRNARKLGQAIANLKDTHPAVFKEIEDATEHGRDILEGFNKRFKEDVEKGFIKQEELQNASVMFPVFIDQIAGLSRLTDLRNKLLTRVDSGIFGASLSKASVIADLDNFKKLIGQQADMLDNSLKSLEKKIQGKKAKEDSQLAQLLTTLRGHTDLLKGDRLATENALMRLRKIAKDEIDPVNKPEFKKTIDNMFGFDDTNPLAIAEQLRLQQKTTADKIDPNTGEEIPIDALALDIANKNVRQFGIDQRESIRKSYQEIQTAVNDKYEIAKLKDVYVPIDNLLGRYTSLIAESSPSTRAYSSTEQSQLNRFTKVIQDARRNGLLVTRQRYANDEDYLGYLIETDTKFDKSAGTFNPQSTSAFEESLLELTDEQAIKLLENRLVKKDIYTKDSGLILQTGKNDQAFDAIIPVSLSVSEFVKMRSRAMVLAATKRGSDKHLSRKEVEAFDTEVNSLLNKTAEEDIQKKGAEAMEAFKDAQRFYANTMGKTFKLRLGKFFKEETVDTYSRQAREDISDEDMFSYFIRYNSPKEAAEQFKIMFSDLDPVTGKPMQKGERYEQAEKLLLKSVARYIRSEQGQQQGLKKLKQDFIDHFLSDLETTHILENGSTETIKGLGLASNAVKTNKEIKNDFFMWRTKEIEAADQLELFKREDDELLETFKSLEKDQQDKIKASIFADVDKAKSDQIFDKFFANNLMEADAAFHAAREDIDFFRKRAYDPDDPTVTPEMFEDFMNHRDVVDRQSDFFEQLPTSKAKREQSFKEMQKGKKPLKVDPLTTDDVIQRLNVPFRRGASVADSPVRVLLDSFDYDLNKQAEVRELLKSLFVRKMRSDAFALTESKTFQSFGHQKIFSLQKDIKIDEFGNALRNNEKTLDILFEDAPEHLEEIKEIFQIGVMVRGTTPSVPMPEMGKQMALNSLISRFYSISRGVVSPRYVATEVALQQGQYKKSQFLLELLTEPESTSIILDTMRAVRQSKDEITKERVQKFKKLSMAIFFSGIKEEDDQATVKDDTWIRGSLEFLADIVSSGNRMDKDKKDDKDISKGINLDNINTNTNDIDLSTGINLDTLND